METETKETTKEDGKRLFLNEEKIPDSKGNIVRQTSHTKDFPQKTDPGQALRQNSRDFIPRSPRPNKDNPFFRQQPKIKNIEPKQENKTNDYKDEINDGEKTLARALKSLRSTQSFEEKEEESEIIAD